MKFTAEMTGLTDQRVIVTAAAVGIGREITNSFLTAGARVFTCDIDRGRLDALVGHNDRLDGCMADVSSNEQVDHMFDQATAFLGGLDIVVNNAGIGGPIGSLETVSPSEWQETLCVNLNGMFYCLRRAIPLIKQSGGGSIVNISSTAGLFGIANRSAYVASKWGVIGLTKSLAVELGPFAIRVNAICPGSVAGDRIDRVIAKEALTRGQTEEEIRADFVSSVSLKTLIQPADVAQMALFLCSNQGRYISGQALTIDGNTETKW